MPALLVLGGCPGKPPTPTKTPHLAAVSVSCAPNPVTVGGTSTCAASATDEDGQPFSVSGYTWSSSDTAVATVDAQGTATSTAVGTATLSASATADGVTQQGQTALSVIAKPTTVHSAPITQNETWRTADNPHVVRGQLTVDSGATLTLEPGADVRFEPEAELRVRDGALQAAGTAQAGIQLSANGSTTPGTWRGVVLASNKSVSKWSFVTLRSCGQATGEKACLTLLNQAAPVLQDVTVSGSGGVGVKGADDGSAFGADSARLTVTGSAGYAVSLGANQASTLPPASTFTGNVPNAIALSGNVTRTQTWPTASVPYVLNSDVAVRSVSKDSLTTLTLSAGMVLRFGARAAFSVGQISSPSVSAILNVAGTDDAPVRFTADLDQPVPGYWRGVHMLTDSTPSQLSHVIIEYAGDNSGQGTAFGSNGNLNLYGTGLTAEIPRQYTTVLTDVVLQKGSGPGLTSKLGFIGAASARVTVRGNATHAIVMDNFSVASAPTDTVFQDNAVNDVRISADQNVYEDVTWPKLSVPYYIDFRLDVGNNPPVTLKLQPGTELQFSPDGGIVVGYDLIFGPGILDAQGTAAAPIRFVIDPASPSAFWGGLHFWHADGSQLDHVYVYRGGGYNTRPVSEGVFCGGLVGVYREFGPFIKNSTFELSYSGYSILGSQGSETGTQKVTTQFFDAQYNNTSLPASYRKQGNCL